MAVATVLHAVTSQSVDAVLAVILMVGGVIGAQFGARIGQNIRGDQLRALLALLVIAVALRFLTGLVVTPEERYSLSASREAGCEAAWRLSCSALVAHHGGGAGRER